SSRATRQQPTCARSCHPPPGRRCASSCGTRRGAGAPRCRPASAGSDRDVCDAAPRETCRSLRASHLAGLPGLAQNLLALVANALALVRLGLATLADVGGDLAHELLVGAAHREAGGRLNDELDAGW